MKGSAFVGLLTGALAISGGSARAQSPSPGPQTTEQVQARYQILVMEAVLEQAVRHGAQMLGRQVRTVLPETVFVAGAARARGFRLEGYGVFFDVEVPALRRSLVWSVRTMLDDHDPALDSALQSLRRHVQQREPDPRARASLEQALKRVELLVGPLSGPPGPPALAPGRPPMPGDAATVSAAVVEPQQPAPPVEQPAKPEFLTNPDQAYTDQVKDALIDAMLDHSGPMALGPEEWLTVAARDNEDRILAPGDPSDLATIMLRIRGSDLAAFRASRITRDEARKKVDVREF